MTENTVTVHAFVQNACTVTVFLFRTLPALTRIRTLVQDSVTRGVHGSKCTMVSDPLVDGHPRQRRRAPRAGTASKAWVRVVPDGLRGASGRRNHALFLGGEQRHQHERGIDEIPGDGSKPLQN